MPSARQYKRTGITAGFEPAGGGYAEYVRVMPFVLPGVVRIPARNSFLEGAMLEPVNTVLKAVRRLALLRGDTVLVAGQGPIGLMFTRLLALRGHAGGGHGPAADAAEAGARVRRGERSSKSEGRRPEQSRKQKAESRNPRSVVSGQFSLTFHAHASRSLPPWFSDSPGRGLDAAVIAVPSDAVVREAQALVRGGGQVLLFSHTRRGD